MPLPEYIEHLYLKSFGRDQSEHVQSIEQSEGARAAHAPWVAYYRLPHEGSRHAHDSRLVEPGMVVDYGPSGSPIGIEITAPAAVTLEQLNALLEELGQRPLDPQEFAPLHAA